MKTSGHDALATTTSKCEGDFSLKLTREALLELQEEHEVVVEEHKKMAEDKRLTEVALSTYRENFLKNKWDERVSEWVRHFITMVDSSKNYKA